MVDTSERIQRVIEEIAGNEALLEMLETEAAAEMLSWGTEMATSLAKKTEDEEALLAALESSPANDALGRELGSW